jgi:hypothetical protein
MKIKVIEAALEEAELADVQVADEAEVAIRVMTIALP